VRPQLPLSGSSPCLASARVDTESAQISYASLLRTNAPLPSPSHTHMLTLSPVHKQQGLAIASVRHSVSEPVNKSSGLDDGDPRCPQRQPHRTTPPSRTPRAMEGEGDGSEVVGPGVVTRTRPAAELSSLSGRHGDFNHHQMTTTCSRVNKSSCTTYTLSKCS
jgi:hypothetical protein